MPRPSRGSAQSSARPPAPPGPVPVTAFTHHLSRAERYAAGRSLREKCPRASHAAWAPAPDRPDALATVLAAEAGRMPELLPLRHGRMVASPFTFYRGSALAMATDLAKTPVSGIRVQCCGDAHLSNFGGFATPERRIIFSLNDLDETLPAPWEWDVKRLATSIVCACRDRGLSDAKAREVVLSCVRAYRRRMAEFGEMRTLELWYTSLDAHTLTTTIRDPKLRRRVVRRLATEMKRSRGEELFPKLAEGTADNAVIKDQLPTIFHWKGHTAGEIHESVKTVFAGYRDSLHSSYRALLDRFEAKDAAVKVVGVGSVGTLCFVMLLMAAARDPLFIQIKEARASVLEPFAGPSAFPNHGQRIVNGYRLMQPASDIFLGYARGPEGRDFFFRQLRDVKISARLDTFGQQEMALYTRWCGWALALAHARGGDAAMITGYLGKSDAFDKALAAFAIAYADQNEQDHSVLQRAIREGRIEAEYDKE